MNDFSFAYLKGVGLKSVRFVAGWAGLFASYRILEGEEGEAYLCIFPFLAAETVVSFPNMEMLENEINGLCKDGCEKEASNFLH
jgi:hypothetical protein